MPKVITGAFGFIGSCLVSELNRRGETDLILVDDFKQTRKEANLKGKQYLSLIDRDHFIRDLSTMDSVDFIYHLGARTDTTEMDAQIHTKLNLEYSKDIWKHCVKQNIPLIYASSAATYGDGNLGFDDRTQPEELKPLNPYGESKNNFDDWALKQDQKPSHWIGMKFFNVFGPNEYHKGRMASVVMHAYQQIQKNGSLKLFQSHRDGIANGEQKRDFIYIKDLLQLIDHWTSTERENGIYNAGSGIASSFNQLASAIFKAMSLEENIQFIPTPEDIREKYQYFTQADMSRTQNAGYRKDFMSLDKAVEDYIHNYLTKEAYF